jgi:hypothetical protein
VPISIDIAGHIMEKGHTNFTPIRDEIPSLRNKAFLPVPNISFSKKWNKKVRPSQDEESTHNMNTIP